jgi:hypothetical protein
MTSMARIASRLALGTACIFTVYAAASAPVRAQSIDGLLDLLKAKGEITQAEYDKLKASQQAETKGTAAKVQAAEAKASAAEAKANAAQAQASEAQAKTTELDAKARAALLSAADMATPMPTKAPVAYVTALPNCVGWRVGTVDVCFKGDLVFFGIEQFPDKAIPAPVPIAGGLATAGQTDANSVRGGLLPSAFTLTANTHQNGIDVGVDIGIYTGGVNVDGSGLLNANTAGAPFALGTPGIDFRQFFGTLGTPTFGTVKVGRDLGLFGSDAILNDLTLFGVGTPAGNWAPGNTTLGRIGIGYIYADWDPQITYTSPNFSGFTFSGGVFQPIDELTAFGGDINGANLTAHDVPMLQGQLKYVTAFAPAAKLTLSTDILWQRQVCDVTEPAAGIFSSCGNGPGGPVVAGTIAQGQSFDAWAWDGFGMLDIYGFNLVAYGYEGRGVGTEGLFFDGIDVFGDMRKSYGGYGQVSYTFPSVPFTIGGSYGVSYLDSGSALDLATNPLLVHKNESEVGFVRYQLTKWVKLQAEYAHTRAVDQVGDVTTDDMIAAGTDFFW